MSIPLYRPIFVCTDAVILSANISRPDDKPGCVHSRLNLYTKYRDF